MSVIAGLTDWNASSQSGGLHKTMLAAFRHHLPDGYQTLRAGPCALGVGVLNTTRSDKRLERVHRLGDVYAAVDGKLDRSTDICSYLDLEKAASDAEIVATAYQRFGTEFFGRIRGEFAIVIWDDRSQTMVAGRDSFGIRPLCYAVTDRYIAVASDPEQILVLSIVPKTADDDMVLDYLLWNARFVDRTFFREIKALSPGHFGVGNRGTFSVSRFHSPALAIRSLSSQKESWTEYRRGFRAAVRSCLDSSSPVVAELSGGLDSSSIVCVADELLKEDPELCPDFVAAAGLYPGLTCDEEPFIQAVARHVRTKVECWNALDVSVNELDPSSVALPGGRFSTFAGTEGQLHIAQSRRARVLLSGVGGDQIGTPSGGIRDAFTDLRWSDTARMIFQRPGRNAATVVDTVKALARSFVPDSVRQHYHALRKMESRPVWLTEWARSCPRLRPERDVPAELGSEIQRRTWRSLTSGPHSLVMAYIQHHAIRNGIEVRFPFLAADLVATALSISSRLWPPPWPSERLHRDILRKWLPPEVADRRGKANFEPAVILRARRHVPFMRDLLASAEWHSGRFVAKASANRLLSRFMDTERSSFSDAYGLWTIVTLEAWMRAVSRYAPSPERE